MSHATAQQGGRRPQPDRRLADIAKNGRERVHVTLTEYKGARFVDLRTFATGSDGALTPTKAGIAIRPHMIRATIAALHEAEKAFAAEGLLQERAEPVRAE